MKILIHANAPWAPSGYGTQCALFARQFRDAGHDVAISATWGLGGSPVDWEGLRVFPADGQHGKMTLRAIADHVGKDCQVITLQDVWVLTDAVHIAKLPRLASWVPVDHDPVPPKVAEFFRNSGSRPIAMSRFGERKLQEVGLDPFYVPHGVDTSIFRPMPEHRAGLREMFQIPDEAFVVGMCANNSGVAPPRKAFPQVFQAFARFHRDHPDSFLYLHTLLTSPEGLDLTALAMKCGLDPDCLKFTGQVAYALDLVEAEGVAAIMNMFDVLANPSYGEGFGIPIIEAQACGVPVIVTDHTSMPELCGAGWLVGGDLWYDPPHGSFFKCPSIGDIADAMGEAYTSRGDKDMAATARDFALGYDAGKVMEDHWAPVLATLEAAEPRTLEPRYGEHDPASAISPVEVEIA